jgi:4-azaleucine resistance transporter AzlC
VAITFGLIVRSGGLSVLDAGLASVLAFAGAAQFLAAQMFLSGAAVVQIVISGWLLNLRHLLMSSVVADHLDRGTTVPVRSVLAFGITDEVFGVAGRKAAAGASINPAFLAGLELGAYLAWVGGTIVGAVAGNVLPPSVRDAMGMALYALFAALLAGLIREAVAGSRRRMMVFTALTAGGLNWLLRGVIGLDAGLAFPLAMVAAALVFSGGDSGERA